MIEICIEVLLRLNFRNTILISTIKKQIWTPSAADFRNFSRRFIQPLHCAFSSPAATTRGMAHVEMQKWFWKSDSLKKDIRKTSSRIWWSYLTPPTSGPGEWEVSRKKQAHHLRRSFRTSTVCQEDALIVCQSIQTQPRSEVSHSKPGYVPAKSRQGLAPTKRERLVLETSSENDIGLQASRPFKG